MIFGSLRLSLGRNSGMILAEARAWATGLALLLGVAIPVAIVPEPAWGQFSSGSYSRSGGGSKSYAAPVRRPSAPSSGGYYRRSPATPSAGYSTGSAGDRAMSRGRSSEALRDYRQSQQPPPDTYARRPPASGSDSGWGGLFGGGVPTQARRPPTGGGGWWGSGPAAGPSMPGFGTGIVTGVALSAAL